MLDVRLKVRIWGFLAERHFWSGGVDLRLVLNFALTTHRFFVREHLQDD